MDLSQDSNEQKVIELQQINRPENIPVWIFEDLQRYVDNLQAPGSFVRAILENNLRMTVLLAADSYAKDSIPHVVYFLHTNAPDICWGSPEKVQAWLECKLH